LNTSTSPVDLGLHVLEEWNSKDAVKLVRYCVDDGDTLLRLI